MAEKEMSPELLERIKKCLSYNPETGVFTWIRKKSDRIHIGDIAGSKCASGSVIKFNYVSYEDKVLAWLFYYGEMPKGRIVYRNGNRRDCRINNLKQL